VTGAPAILAEGVRQTFGDVVALDGLDLEVEAGTVFGLLGPNGAGKTTLVRVLATLLRPTAGRASVLGRDVVADPLAVRRLIGLAGQFAAVDEELTGRENVEMIGCLYRLPGSEARARARELLERFGLADAADRRVSTYSGGMRRRLDLTAEQAWMGPLCILQHGWRQAGGIVRAQDRHRRAGKGEVDQCLVPSRFHDLSGPSTRPDRLTDEPAMASGLAVYPLEDRGNDAAGITTELVHVQEVDPVAPTIQHCPHRSDLRARNRDQHRLVCRDSSFDELPSPGHELVAVRIEQRQVVEIGCRSHELAGPQD
jgi:ABC-type transport system involved in cytochrome c biogenesis ATPase subunit